MEDGLKDLINQTRDVKVNKEKKYKEDSRNRLLKISAQKIQTTMIGALSSIENHFGFLWNHDDGDENLSSESQHMKQLYEDVRSEILDKGNHQARNIDVELLEGYQLKYIYFIDKKMESNLTKPIIPFSEIDKIGAGMYKGEKITLKERQMRD